jgi:phosphoserine phosphatase RsbX
MIELEIGIAQRPCKGQEECGDCYSIRQSGHVTTIALADGLGHGPLAAEAAQLFCSHVETCAAEELVEVVRLAQVCLEKTRGVAGTILRIDHCRQTIEHVGVGNINLQAVSAAPIRPISVPGIIGRPVRKIVPFSYPIQVGDLLILHSDGISSRFQADFYKYSLAQTAADELMNAYGKDYDDATCIVIRYDDVAARER